MIGKRASKSAASLHLEHEKDSAGTLIGADSNDVEHIGKKTTVSGPVDKATERKLLRKLDLRIVPMVMWMYLMSFMDRVIIGNALLYGLEDDLGLTGNDFQLSVSLLFITYCLFETPSNMIIKRLNPGWYLAGLTAAWGIVASCTALVQNLTGLIVCRLLLGLFEAGFFPGVIIYLTMFYNKSNIALRMGYFFSASAISSAVGGLVAYGIGQGMDYTAGWRAWRWILLINGLATVVTGLVVPFVLPNSVESAKFLTDADRHDLALLRAAEIGQTETGQELLWEDVKDGMKDWKTYAFGAAQFCSNLMLYSFSVFLPTIINQIGDWDVAQAQALTVPVFAVGAIVYIIAAKVSDIVQLRGPFVICAQFTSLIGYALLLSNVNGDVSYAGTFIVATGCYIANGMAVAWLATNNPRYGKRAYASGIQLSIGNSAGVAAPFLFSAGTGPAYTPGYAASIGTLAFAMVVNTILCLWYWWQNKQRSEGKLDWKMDNKSEEEVAEMGDKSPLYRYTI